LGNLAANVVPLAILVLVARSALLRFIMDLGAGLQVLVHTLSAIAFSVIWYIFLMVLLSTVEGDAFMSFSVRPFLGAAALWQMMQGVTFYALTALLAYVERLQATAPPNDDSAVIQRRCGGCPARPHIRARRRRDAPARYNAAHLHKRRR
ncbi:MAG: hypothetical protein HRT64_14390, partial [Erythrobacter sp.]|nr:hypothetical protein [Erythrobacter sp.]